MKRIVLLSLIFISCWANATWQKDTTVSQIVVEGSEDGERVYVVFAANFNPSGCTNTSGYKRVYANTKKGELLMSTLLTAYAAQRTVLPSINGCDDWGRSVLTGVILK